ncbi:MAG: energy-coupling factor ABC transporter ATP-binding protein [Caldilineales bacterium]|nr:energy-coupling factor ABC transporter ATP-binding protein [Caldilineales bacterium]
MKRPTVIAIEHLTYTYPATERPALRDLSLTIPAGQFCAVLGANGAGKSTLCYALAGFVPHFYRGRMEGRVMVAGHDIAATPPSALVGLVGLVFANPFNQITGACYTVREEVAFGLENLGVPPAEMEPRIAQALAVTGLTDLADRSPFALSGGQQQRLALAAVLAMQPQVLVLDEPTSQLDPAGTREVFAVLGALAARHHTTVVLVSQALEWVATYADRVIVLAEGRLVADGAPTDVLTRPEMETWGVGATRYTQAARRGQAQGLAPTDRPLPVTLPQAVAFWS